MAMDLASFDNSSSALFYPEFKFLGVSGLLIAMNALKSVVASLGIVLNLSLVLVTILSKSLHGSCNFLLALDSLFYAIYCLSPFPGLVLTISGQNFLALPECFLLQFLSILGVNMNFGLMLFIGLERVASILFPIWFNNRNPNYYLPAMVGLCALISALNLFNLYGVQSADIMVLCSLPDCYRGEPGQMLYRNGLITICLTLGCYLLIWLQMRRSLAKKNAKVNPATRRLFKSLVVLICSMFFGWVVDICVRLFLPRMALSSMLLLVLSNVLSNCSFIAAASNPLILYTFSKDYRAAYNTQLNRLFKSVGLQKWHFSSTINGAATLVVANQPSNGPNREALGHRSGSVAVMVSTAGVGWAVEKVREQQRSARSSLNEGRKSLPKLG